MKFIMSVLEILGCAQTCFRCGKVFFRIHVCGNMKKYYREENAETESFRIFERNGIETGDGKEDAVVADFYQSTPKLAESVTEFLNKNKLPNV